jgi:DNA mismatch repair protein MutL
MSRIRRLPDHLVNKIAAGEVVERPASVVKELAENAIDARAQSVVIELKDAGRQLIRVSDDGWGMSADEIELALTRHATSKIASEEDLDAIETLGFRGEALPAICAVTRFSLVSCPQGSEAGRLVRGESGVVKERLDVAARPGTTVEIQDLFFNTPARLKFLKSAQSELAAILRLLYALALAHPAVRFRVVHNGRAALTAPRAGSLRDRLGALLGFDLAGRMLELQAGERAVAIAGLVSPPQLARGNRDEVTLIVNGRPVRDGLLGQTLLEAYRPLLARDQFPVAVVRIDVPAREVDVNVHPTKAWVRFRAPRLVQEVLFSAVQEALRSSRVVQAQPGLAVAGVEGGPPTAAGADPAMPRDADPASAAGLSLFQEDSAAFRPVLFGTVVGQLQDTFIVAASEEEVFFIDQHVAHERVLFERLKGELDRGALAGQALLFPQALELGPGQADLLEAWAPTLERLGFGVERFGAATVLLRAVPSLLTGEEPRRLIEGLLDEMRAPRREDAAPLLDRALAFVACRAAIKAHAPLERQEMTRLLADLSGTETPYFCPHGRPIVSRLSLREIKRELRRTW